MKEIEEDAYIKTLQEILQKKSGQLEEKNPFIKRDKVARYAIQKGFEPELVWTHVKELVKD
jgi:regulatory protein